MNLFSDNKRIIKNNFQIILSPTTVKKESLIIIEEPITNTIEVEVELYHIYEPETTTHNNTIDETNPMIKSK